MASLSGSRTGLATVGIACVGFVAFLALAGPFLSPYSPEEFVGAPFQPPGGTLWLGADALGRDALSRVLSGGYRTLGLAAVATVLGVAAGALLGMAAGFLKGTADEAIMRLLDVALAFPQMIFALLFLSILGSDPWLVVLVVAAVHAPQVARVARAGTLRVAGEDFVRHAEAIGTPPLRILLREILPNISVPLLVELGLRYTYSIALIAGLSFLGLGQQPPTPDWGLMINENRIGMGSNPWPVLAPVILIVLLTIGVNLVTDALARRSGATAAETSR
ncbi:MAG: ABC transporter permease [Rhizobiaceae bacterium]|nr:ABC transporter permease [Rhizobiaceae bacterium]